MNLPVRSYTTACITGLPRSGTTLLRSFLNSHPDMLFHNEIFHANSHRRAMRPSSIPSSVIRNGADPFHYLHSCIFPPDARGKRVIGFKLFPSHAQNRGWEMLWRWAMEDPSLSVVHIERENAVEMALSMQLAKRDGRWHRRWNEPALRHPQAIRIPYEDVERNILSVIQDQRMIRDALRSRHHVSVAYADLVRSPHEALKPVQEYLSVTPALLWNSDKLLKKSGVGLHSLVSNLDELRERLRSDHPEWSRWIDEAVSETHGNLTPVFYMQLFHDGHLADAALRRLRKQYPEAEVILLSDGDDDHRYPQLAHTYHARYVRGARLYGRENGGLMLQRMFDEYLKTDGDWLIKIDTDTRIDRRFTNLPVDRAVYGMPLRKGPPQGGCVIFPRNVAQELSASGVLRSDALLDPRSSWGTAQYPSFLEEHLEQTGRMSFEWVLYWACNCLGIEVKPCMEIHSTWKQGIANADMRYAAVHPDKFMHIEHEAVHDACIDAHGKASGIYLDALFRSR